MNGNGYRDNLLYHLIAQEEWSRLVPIFQKLNKFMPPAQLAIASIAETSQGEIGAMVAVQAISYMGPLYLNPKFEIDYARLKAPIDEVYSKGKKSPLILQGYVAMTADEQVARIAESAGMTRHRDAILLTQEFGEQHTLIG